MLILSSSMKSELRFRKPCGPVKGRRPVVLDSAGVTKSWIIDLFERVAAHRGDLCHRLPCDNLGDNLFAVVSVAK